MKITGAVDNASDYQLMTAAGGFTVTGLAPSWIPRSPDYELQLQNGDTELVAGLHRRRRHDLRQLVGRRDRADGDANGDGVQNAVAYALGAADVNENAIGLLPTFDNSSDPTYFIFTYDRNDAARRGCHHGHLGGVGNGPEHLEHGSGQ